MRLVTAVVMQVLVPQIVSSIHNIDQGGIFPGSQGARLPRNLQAPTKSWQQFTLFWCEFDFKVFLYFLSNEGILPITHSMQEIFFLSQEEGS